MMITVFNREAVCRDATAQDAAAIWSALRAAGIGYKVKTHSNGPSKPAVRMARGGRTGSFASGYTTESAVTIGIPVSQAEGGTTQYFYTVFVAKRDLDKAKQVCNL